MPTFFKILFIFLTCPRLSCCPAMSSLLLLFDLTQDLNMLLLSDVYSTPRLFGNLSVSSRTTTASLSTPLDSSLLSLANLIYSLSGTLCTPGRPVTPKASAYMQLTCCYQQIECELTKEREEHASL